MTVEDEMTPFEQLKSGCESALRYERHLAFIRESNRIEGITRDPTAAEIDVFKHFLERPKLTVADLQNFVHVCAPGAELRDRRGMNVVVGDHRPPPGGKKIREHLEGILDWVNRNGDPYAIHCSYETFHPFMDGNGRSGRAIWAWQIERMEGVLPVIGFLHSWYYMSLSMGRA